jgi:hypothetical protein
VIAMPDSAQYRSSGLHVCSRAIPGACCRPIQRLLAATVNARHVLMAGCRYERVFNPCADGDSDH